MYSLIFSVLIMMSALPEQANYTNLQPNDEDKTFIIKEQYFNDFAHVTLPDTEVIEAKGGIPAIQSIYGLQVRVVSSAINEEGDKIVVLARVDGGKFFYSLDTLTANLTKAIEAQELEPMEQAAM